MAIAKELTLLENSKTTLDMLTDELKKRGYILAAAEREYRKALALKEVSLKSRGNNYPANMAIDIAKGTPEIAELRYKRDVAQIEYEVCKDKLRNERTQIEALRSIMAWNRASYLNG